MRKRTWWIIAGIAVFIGVNVLLISLDKENRIDKIAYTTDWTTLEKRDLHASYQTDGVVRYGDESNVYFDKNLGNFNEFLVKKGQSIHSGDPLFSYYVNDYDQAKTALEQRADLLNAEQKAIETAIGKVQTGSAATPSTTTGGSGRMGTESGGIGAASEPDRQNDNTLQPQTSNKEVDQRISALQDEFKTLQNQVESADSEQAKALKAQYIAEKEKELEQKNAEQKSVQSQISALSTEGNTITVESPFSGNVTKLSKTLKDPLLTIQDPDNLQIAGKITEKQRSQTEEGMEIAIAMQEGDVKLKGEINELSDDPIDIKVYGQSLYPFAANFKSGKQNEKLLPGYHAAVEILTKVLPGALSVEERAILQNNIWVMNYKGKLVQQKAKTGISENGWIEVKNELQPGDWLAVAPESHFRNQATFITPLKISKLQWKDLQTDKKSNFKYLITGIISR